MPLRIFLRPSLALLLLAAPIAARADFPAPNPDELKMTSEPKAPGAGAVRQQKASKRMHGLRLGEVLKDLPVQVLKAVGGDGHHQEQGEVVGGVRQRRSGQ